jgi:hypothetical protein
MPKPEHIVVAKGPQWMAYGPFKDAVEAQAFEAEYPLYHPEWKPGQTFCTTLTPPESWFIRGQQVPPETREPKRPGVRCGSQEPDA